ncbi:reverse transcriptase [Gossypium australe]|uniref:Reverse transcriptase n=1 Tax=Gossypium australe TaxID=47621 RepID=A0A5B6UGT8_9ROSI|nr:reverse transcriptase [Gossypium australe]
MIEWNGGFLEGMMKQMGFATEWISLVIYCITSVSYTVSFNGGLCQGDPLSPYLFLICTEGFSALLNSAVQMSNLRGVKVCRGCPTVTHLFFANDSIVFGDTNEIGGRVLLDILRRYESALGQKINLDKLQIFFSSNVSDNSCNQLVQMLGVRHSLCMERYLGLPTMVGRRKKDAFQYICDRMRIKVQSWRARLLSQGGKEVFIRAVLQAIPTYSMSCFLLPKTLCTKLESIMSRFWWQKSSTRKGMHWCNWVSLSLLKTYGGMGFKDIGKFNIVLLAKQGWRLVTNLDSLLGRIYKAKYYPHTSFWNATLGNNSSYAWKSIYAARKVLEDGIGWRVGSGSQISVLQARWLPRWAGEKFKQLLQTVGLIKCQNLLINQQRLGNLFTPMEAHAICCILLSIYTFEDKMVWCADNSDIYTVHSGYRCLVESNINDTTNTDYTRIYKKIWELNLLPKIKIAIWRFTYEYIPTDANLYNRRISSSPICPNYGEALENFLHTLLMCGPAKNVWRSLGVAT